MSISTNRLILEPLILKDDLLILELLNTEGWLRFIGDRNIKTITDAANYIKKINDNPDISYFVVRLKNDNTSIGIATLIKRDYLLHHDIDFALLPEYFGKGYAFEMAEAAIKYAREILKLPVISAITVAENKSSIKLLEKLGLKFSKNILIENDNEELMLFSN